MTRETYRDRRRAELRRILDVGFDQDNALRKLVDSLVGDVEHERANRADQVRRKRVGQATTRALIDAAPSPALTREADDVRGKMDSDGCPRECCRG